MQFSGGTQYLNEGTLCTYPPGPLKARSQNKHTNKQTNPKMQNAPVHHFYEPIHFLLPEFSFYLWSILCQSIRHQKKRRKENEKVHPNYMFFSVQRKIKKK